MTHELVPHGITKGCHMAPWVKDTWHESHVVWMVTRKACVHVTHGHERKGRNVRGSILSPGIRPTKWKEKKKQTIRWDGMKTKNGGKRKIKRKKREKKERK